MVATGVRLVSCEADLAEIWRLQAFRRTDLRGTNGLQLKVVYPGRPTSAPGPDFRQAIISLADATLLRGDVELHCDETDWWRHGHHLDPLYNGVILHVVLAAGRPAVKANGEPIVTLELGPRLSGRGWSLATAVHSAPPGRLPCRQALDGRPSEKPASLLAELARQRFRDKAAVFEGSLAVDDPEQVFYAGLMQALGYGGNRGAFDQLASLARFEFLKVALRSRPAEGRALALERLLLGCSGLINEPPSYGLARLTAGAWQLRGIRPGNHPVARIRAFAHVLAGLAAGGLLEALLGPLEAAAIEGKMGAGQLRILRSRWQLQLAPFGRQRVDEIAINVLLPFAAALGETMNRYLLAEAARELFLIYPAAGPNHVTSSMSELLGSQGSARGAAGEQALLLVWERWCREKLCRLCPLGQGSRARLRRVPAAHRLSVH